MANSRRKNSLLIFKLMHSYYLNEFVYVLDIVTKIHHKINTFINLSLHAVILEQIIISPTNIHGFNVDIALERIPE